MHVNSVPRTLIKNTHVKWAQDPHSVGATSPHLSWVDAHATVAQISPRVGEYVTKCLHRHPLKSAAVGLVVCDATFNDGAYVRLCNGSVASNVVNSALQMEIFEVCAIAESHRPRTYIGVISQQEHIATFIHVLPHGMYYRYHVRFNALLEWLEFTRTVQDAKIAAEVFRLELVATLNQVLRTFPVEDSTSPCCVFDVPGLMIMGSIGRRGRSLI